MANITIRNLDERTKLRLKIRAAHNACSMEEEVRNIICAVLAEESASGSSLAESIRHRFEKLGGLDLKLPERTVSRQPPAFN